MSLTQRLPKTIRRSGRYIIRATLLLRAMLYDFRRFSRLSSCIFYEDDEEKLRALITAAYHNIEKGLSLPAPRLGFGAANISKLIKLIDDFLSRYGPRAHLAVPISVLNAYVVYHHSREKNVDDVKNAWARLAHLNAAHEIASPGGVIIVSKSDIERATRKVSQEFFDLRFSCRQYSDAPITDEQIRQAVASAQKSPVVCNRQSGRVWAYTQAGDIQRLLVLQGGARGFAEHVKALFCITVDLRNFHGVGERYQGWIDGGMFAMSFILGLHRQAIGSCCLNWSKDERQDRQMRESMNLPAHETIVMFIAAGHMPAQITVARSTRKTMDEVLIMASLPSEGA